MTPGTVAGAGGAEGTVALPGIAPVGARLKLPRARVTFGPRAGGLALAALILGAFAVVLFATAGQSVLAPRSYLTFPHWESGPLHHLFGSLTNNVHVLTWGFSAVVVLALIAYAIVLSAARSLSMRTIAICVVALHAIALLSPPLHLTDVFSYLGYARLGGLHHLNPYTHVIKDELRDPVYHFASWHNLRSPYGPLFTALTYPLAYVSLPVAYWILKAVTVLMSLGFIALVWQCARQLGRDPRFPVLFVAANPIFVFYALAGFHNDFFMLVPSTAAMSFMLARHDRAAGAAVMLAVAVKFTAILLLPFLLLAVLTRSRRLRMLEGAAVATVPLVAMSLALFGLHIPNLADQSTLLTGFSIPNMFGLVIGLGGGTPGLLWLLHVLLVPFVLYELRRNRDWLSGAGWSTFALIASLAWLVPWYVMWLLPLAGLGTSIRLRRVAAALTVYLVFAFVPATGVILSEHGINPLGSAIGQASVSRQNKLGG